MSDSCIAFFHTTRALRDAHLGRTTEVPGKPNVNDTFGVIGRIEPRTRRPYRVTALAIALTACKLDEPGEPVHAPQLSSVASPANDPSTTCTDLGAARICYSELCPGGICVLERPWMPEILSRTAEYRCSGAGKNRVCRARRELASPFACERGRCVQLRPRLPDDNEWECADIGGMVLCRGGFPAAGVLRLQTDVGWWCGVRRAQGGERLCLDLDPDRPSELGVRARCRFETDGARQVRICERGDTEVLGDRCETESDCPPGARCARGICVPPTLRPTCWSDADCKPEQCQLASCGDENG